MASPGWKMVQTAGALLPATGGFILAASSAVRSYRRDYFSLALIVRGPLRHSRRPLDCTLAKWKAPGPPI
jgi:hypothetical protein